MSEQDQTSIEVEPRRMRRGVSIAAWAGVLGILALLGFGLVRSQQGPVGVGAMAPEFVLNTFDGDQLNSADMPPTTNARW